MEPRPSAIEAALLEDQCYRRLPLARSLKRSFGRLSEFGPVLRRVYLWPAGVFHGGTTCLGTPGPAPTAEGQEALQARGHPFEEPLIRPSTRARRLEVLRF